MAKRLRNKKCAPGQLRMYWGREGRGQNPDVMLAYGGGGASKRDTALLHHYLCSPRPHVTLGRYPQEISPSLIDELIARGYDITTLEFSIKRLPDQIGVDHAERS